MKLGIIGVGGTSDKGRVSGIYSPEDNIVYRKLVGELDNYSYANKSFSVTLQDTSPTSAVLSSDGTKMYVSGDTGNAIYQYTLSTPYDVNTASYASKSFNVGTQDTTILGVSFKDDGTRMYVCGSLNNRLYQYNLSTPWDITTSVYGGIRSYSITQESNVTGLSFRPDGTTAYVVGTVSDTIYQYSLSTPWDLTTISYASKSLAIGSTEGLSSGVAISTDGTKAYIIGQAADKIVQYNLGTPWDISTGTLYKGFSILTQDTASVDVGFSTDGTKAYVLGDTSDVVYQYTLGTAWDINTASYASKSFNAQSQDTASRGLAFKPDGTSMYIVGVTNDFVSQYTLSTPWDVSTASYANKNAYIGFQDGLSQSVGFSSNGLKMYVLGQSNGAIYQYLLETPWDLSTANVGYMTFGGQDTGGYEMVLSTDGTKAYMAGDTSDVVYQYTLTAPWTLNNSTTYASKSFSTSSQDGSIRSLCFNQSGNRMYTLGIANDRIYQYNLSTAFDVSTASYANKTIYLNISPISENTAFGIFLSQDESKIYVLGQTTGNVYQFNLLF